MVSRLLTVAASLLVLACTGAPAQTTTKGVDKASDEDYTPYNWVAIEPDREGCMSPYMRDGDKCVANVIIYSEQRTKLDCTLTKTDEYTFKVVCSYPAPPHSTPAPVLHRRNNTTQ